MKLSFIRLGLHNTVLSYTGDLKSIIMKPRYSMKTPFLTAVPQFSSVYRRRIGFGGKLSFRNRDDRNLSEHGLLLLS